MFKHIVLVLITIVATSSYAIATENKLSDAQLKK